MPVTTALDPPTAARRRLRRAWRSTRRVVLARRRMLAATLVAVAVVAGLRAAAPPAPPTTLVLTAARDLGSGSVLGRGDLRETRLPRDSAPPRPVTDPSGRVLAAPLDAGEVLTETRLVGPAMVDLEPGHVPVPVRLPDAQMAGLLRVGDRVDLLAADLQAGAPSAGGAAAAVRVAEDVAVLMVDGSASTGDGATSAVGLPGRLVVLAVPSLDVTRLAQSTSGAYVTFAWSHR